MLPTNRLPIKSLRHHTQPVIPLKMRIDALHPIPQHVATSNPKTSHGTGCPDRKATRFAMVERLGLGKNLLKPMLLLGRGGRTAFNKEHASLEFLAQKQSILGTLHADFSRHGVPLWDAFPPSSCSRRRTKGLREWACARFPSPFPDQSPKGVCRAKLGIDDLGRNALYADLAGSDYAGAVP